MKSIIFISVLLFVAEAISADVDCKVELMAKWAGEPSLRKEPLSAPVDIVIIQHTVTPEATSDENCEKIVKAIRDYQMNTLGFDDIAASFLICGNGKVYEGAGWGLVGAHTKGYNNKSIGISLIGDFTSYLPSVQALVAAKELIACGVINKNLTNEYKLFGHRQLSKTLSPGDVLQKEVETWPHWTAKA